MQLQQLKNSIFLLTLFLLPTQLGKHFWPASALVNGMRIDYLSPTLFITDILIFSLALCLLLEMIIAKSSIRYRMLPLRSLLTNISLDTTMLAISCSLLLSNLVTSSHPVLSLLGIVKGLEMVFWGWYCYHQLQKPEQLRSIVIALAGGIILESFLALGQYWNHGSLGGIWYLLGERTFSSDTPGIANANVNGTLVLRPYGTLPHPNVLAGYLLTGNLFLFAVKNKLSPRLTRLVTLIFALSSIALISTLSRAPIIIGGILVLYLAIRAFLSNSTDVQHRIKNRFISYGTLVNILLVGVMMLFFPPLAGRFISTSLGEEAFVQREILVRAALEMLASHPFLGTGLHTFITALPTYLQSAGPVMLLQPVHNAILLLTAETGLIGQLCIVYFISRTLLELKKKSFYHALPLLVLLLLSMTDHYFITLQQGQMLTTFIFAFSWTNE
jgi:hypothetical protein